MTVLASNATSFTIGLIFLWGILIPMFVQLPLIYIKLQAKNEQAQDEAYRKGARPADDTDVIVVD